MTLGQCTEYLNEVDWLNKDPEEKDDNAYMMKDGDRVYFKSPEFRRKYKAIETNGHWEVVPYRHELNIKSLKDVEVKDPEWEVPGYIPKSQIITVGGDGGSGKTSFWCSILSDISNGHCSIFEKDYAGDVKINDPRKVMFFSSEDPVEEILKPKMQKYNAKMENISFIDLKDNRFTDLKFGTEFLDKLIDHHKPAFIVFDPIQSFIEEHVQMGSRNAMRQCLNPLVGLCNKYGVTIMLIAHANKAMGVWGRRRLADSSDLWDISRAVYLMDRADKDLFYISQEKNNYGAIEKTMLFSIENGVIVPKGFIDKHDKDFQQAKQWDNKNSGAREEAKEFIIDWLKDNGGKVENGDLVEMAEVMGISNNAMRNAKADLKKDGKIKLENEGYGKDKKHYLVLTAL